MIPLSLAVGLCLFNTSKSYITRIFSYQEQPTHMPLTILRITVLRHRKDQDYHRGIPATISKSAKSRMVTVWKVNAIEIRNLRGIDLL